MEQISRLLQIMQALRAPDSGCPWDREQDFASIVPHTLEETYEVADVIEHARFENNGKELCGELGDLLFQIVFYAQLASERGWFNFEDIARGIADKLVVRHPHVFDGEPNDSSARQSLRWEELKAQERHGKGETGVLDGIALALPALSRALKLQKRAARVGFDWNDPLAVIAKVQEELAEVEETYQQTDARRFEELGDLLFVVVNLARHLKVDPEGALRAANAKFERRFRYIENAVTNSGRDWKTYTLAELDALWDEAKKREG